jgi:hypothetical protein
VRGFEVAQCDEVAIGSDDDSATLVRESASYANAGGVCSGNRAHGFLPGFLDTETGEVHASCDANGKLARIHRLDGPPDHLVEARNAVGRLGFLRAGSQS